MDTACTSVTACPLQTLLGCTRSKRADVGTVVAAAVVGLRAKVVVALRVEAEVGLRVEVVVVLSVEVVVGL